MFADAFLRLTGHPPFPWQTRLFERMCAGELPGAVDVPTGLGKTSVIAIWLIALWCGAPVGRRLVYCVDRRTVVDQASATAHDLAAAIAAGALAGSAHPMRSLALSTLRGQHIDNRDWLSDPSAPAVIVGTVDMIGSRLLFEGYGVSAAQRPIHAAYLATDAMILLDEAHLSEPFAALVEGVRDMGAPDLPKLQLMRLSATQTPSDDAHRLTEDDHAHMVVRERLFAPKTLLLEDAPAAGPQEIADRVRALVGAVGTPARIAVYLASREMALKVAALLETRGAVIRLTGARRVFEREGVARALVDAGFIDGEGPPGETVFLVATSAGEVGVDLDADHMVCDLVAFERMVQRFGRINRRGRGAARCVVLQLAEPKDADEAARRGATRTLLGKLAPRDDGFDASPAALRALGERDPAGREAATTPPPHHPPLARALVEAFAMTGLADHTGRPEVAPWLRGWVKDEPANVHLAWRHTLPVAKDRDPDRAMIEAFFDVAGIHLSERLEVEATRIGELLTKARAKHLAALPADDTGLIILSARGDFDRALTFSEFRALCAGEKRAKDAFANEIGLKTLVFDQRVGGLSGGLLDGAAMDPVAPVGDGPGWDLNDEPLAPFILRGSGAPLPGGDVQRAATFTVRYDEAPGEPLETLDVFLRGAAGTGEDARSLCAKPVLLRDHARHVEMALAGLLERLDWPAAERESFLRAARLHDEGKAAPAWQVAMNAPPGGPFAKTSGGNGRALLGYRHEFGSLLSAREGGESDDLCLHLIAAHHGHARPLISTKNYDAAPPSALDAVAGEVAERFARLQSRFGPWGLAYREALLRAADVAASREEAG